MKFQRAFTLIELLVVISVIAVLSAMGVANFSPAVKKSRDVVRKSELAEISQAIMMFRADWGSYPTTSDVSIADPNVQLSFDGHEVRPHYLRQFPIDEARNTSPNEHYYYQCLKTIATTTPERCVDFSICAKLEVPQVSGGNSPVKNPQVDSDGNITSKCTSITDCDYYCVYSP